MTKHGTRFESGTVVLTMAPYVDLPQVKRRPAIVLFEEHGNIVLAGITSNTKMSGIPLTQEEGMPMESVIKLNYLFTVSHEMIVRSFFKVAPRRWSEITAELDRRLNSF